MVPIATEIITQDLTGKPSPIPQLKERDIPYYGVKEAVFPFNNRCLIFENFVNDTDFDQPLDCMEKGE